MTDSTIYQEYLDAVQRQQDLRKRLLAYVGKFDFLNTMKDLALEDSEYVFTERQFGAIEKCLNMEAKSVAGVDDLALDTGLPLGTHYYAVDGDAGNTAFLRIDNVEKGNWAGWLFVKTVSGPNEYRLGSQKPGSSYRGGKPEYIEAVNTDPILAMRRYGKEIGKCGYCGLRLTDERSRELGIGPICRGKLDLD
jgi:hypothetical protein